MLTPEEWRFAIEDARTRHEAVLALIYVNDQQAMSLLSVCITIGAATASGAVASLGRDAVIPHVYAYPLALATVLLAIAAFFCFRSFASATINLPGRDPDFWLWASGAEPSKAEEIYRSYLADLQKQRSKNNVVNQRGAAALKWAKLICAFTPIVVLGFAAIIAITG